MSCAREPRTGSASAGEIVALFDQLFRDSQATVLRGGADEPLYQPALPCRTRSDGEPEAIIYFRDDYAASALHEVAHWCIAGPERRQRVDYGYWYAPDGRDAAQQEAFLGVEAKPQALEWTFACAAGLPFHLSMDNLDGATQALAVECFRGAVARAAEVFCQEGLPERANAFFCALRDRYQPTLQLRELRFPKSTLML